MNEKKMLEMNIAGGMDAYVREVIGDDDITDYWNMCGVPDACDEEMLEEIIETPLCFRNICAAFARCLDLEIENEYYEDDGNY